MTRHEESRDTRRSVFAVGGAFVLVLALITGGWLLLRPDPAPAKSATNAGQFTDLSTTDPASPTATPTSTPAKAKPKTTTKKPTARPTPTKKPPTSQLPPAPKHVPDSPSCTKHPGPDASKAQVRDALVSAGAKEYWQGTTRPSDLQGDLPTITVPANLMKAFAWQESGWQSTIIACDGGIGTMQVMPDTATFTNNRFGTSYDVMTLSGNTSLGAAYIEWLTMYFGLYYFGSFDLTATASVGAGGATMRLRDAVISAYNVGPAALEHDNGTPSDGSDDWLTIPNQSYVNNVTALMTNCVCLSY
jgi:hypothetical protein